MSWLKEEGRKVNGINLGNIRDAYFFAKVGSPLERELGAALDIIDNQQFDINELGEEVDSLKSQIADLETDLDTAYSERDAMENEAADLEGEVRRLEAELAEAQS